MRRPFGSGGVRPGMTVYQSSIGRIKRRGGEVERAREKEEEERAYVLSRTTSPTSLGRGSYGGDGSAAAHGLACSRKSLGFRLL